MSEIEFLLHEFPSTGSCHRYLLRTAGFFFDRLHPNLAIASQRRFPRISENEEMIENDEYFIQIKKWVHKFWLTPHICPKNFFGKPRCWVQMIKMTETRFQTAKKFCVRTQHYLKWHMSNKIFHLNFFKIFCFDHHFNCIIIVFVKILRKHVFSKQLL